MPSFGSQNNGQAPSASGPAYATSPPTLSRNGSFANITTQNGTMTSTFLTGQQPIRPPGAIGSAFPLPIGSGLSPNGFPKEPTSTGSNSLTAQSSSATTPYYTVLIRRLSLDTTEQTICLILSFAKDCVGIDLLPPENSDDPGFLSANVRFASPNGAFEAQKNLHGKKNLKQDATMIVEVVNGARRGTVDMSANATPSSSLSSSRGSGRMAVPFQPFEGVGSSSAGGFFNTNNGAGRFGASDLTNNSEPVGPANQYQLYPNHSPIGVPRARPANRELLEDDAVFPSDPLTMRPPIYNDNMNNNNNSLNAAIREAGLTGPDSDSLAANLESQPFFKRFGSLSLNTEDVVNDSVHGPFTAAPRGAHGAPMSASMGAPGSMSAPMSASASNVRSASMVNSMNSTLNSAMTSPYASFSNTPMPTQPHMMNPLALEVNGYGQAITFPPTSQYQPTHKMPPINLADQNPPCNTLYVGNLPPGAAEEELKAMFSRQRGYKRMCFRTKPNGPMCFVEFENITSATKALLDLYGKPLHNSIKGGIRLSFSKNPLGVRSNQNPHIPMPLAKTNPSHASIGSFPPPGLAAPPGLGNGNVGGGNMAPAHHGNSMQHPSYLDYSGWAPTNASQYHLGATNGDRNGAHPSKPGPSLGGGQGFNPGRF